MPNDQQCAAAVTVFIIQIGNSIPILKQMMLMANLIYFKAVNGDHLWALAWEKKISTLGKEIRNLFGILPFAAGKLSL